MDSTIENLLRHLSHLYSYVGMPLSSRTVRFNDLSRETIRPLKWRVKRANEPVLGGRDVSNGCLPAPPRSR